MMALFSAELQLKIAFFHTRNKVLTEDSQNPYESQYKSAHTQRKIEIWGTTINYCLDQSEADAEAVDNDAVTKYTLEDLTPIPGSNNQSWYLDDVGLHVNPWISPVDIPHEDTNAPSYGFQMTLFQQDGTLITPTEGRWVIDYYSGILQFEQGFTPVDMGWLLPIKGTIFAYTGVGVVGEDDYSFSFNEIHKDITIPIYHQMTVVGELRMEEGSLR